MRMDFKVVLRGDEYELVDRLLDQYQIGKGSKYRVMREPNFPKFVKIGGRRYVRSRDFEDFLLHRS